MATISIEGVRKSFGPVEVLKDISLDIADGEFLTLLGPSGCGKSTLLRIVAGLERNDAGAIVIAGLRVDELPARDRDIAMVFQSYALYPHMTVADNIGLPLSMRRMNAWQRLPWFGSLLPGTAAARKAIARDVAEAAEALDIGALLGRKPGQLSGGAWYAFPGENGLKITDVIKDHLQSVVNGSAKPEAALPKMASDTQALLPK